jgi:hypothetical protein
MRRRLTLLFSVLALTLAAALPAQAQHISGTTAVHEYYNPNYNVKDHFFTTQFDLCFDYELYEYFPCTISTNWQYVREAYWAFTYQETGTVRFHRYWNPNLGDHFWTTNINELGYYPGNNWQYETQDPLYVYTSAQTGTVPLYRYYHWEDADHLYTIDPNELGDGTFDNSPGYVGWIYEGVAAHVSP